MRPRIALILLLAGSHLALPSLAADDPIGIESCTSCHGPAGRSPAAMPVLAGRPAAEIAEKLAGFRNGTLTGTIMHRLAAPLSDGDIAALGAAVAAWK